MDVKTVFLNRNLEEDVSAERKGTLLSVRKYIFIKEKIVILHFKSFNNPYFYVFKVLII